MKKLLLGLFVLSAAAMASGGSNGDCGGQPCDIESALSATAEVKFEANLITPIKLSIDRDCIDFGMILNDKECINATDLENATLTVHGGKNRQYYLSATDSKEGLFDLPVVELKNESGAGGLYVGYKPWAADFYLPGNLGADGKDEIAVKFKLITKEHKLEDGCYSGAMTFKVSYKNYQCGDKGCEA